MSENNNVSTITSLSNPEIETFFGVQHRVPSEVKDKILDIYHISTEQIGDSSKVVDLLKAIEFEVGDEEDKLKKIDKFLSKIRKLKSIKTDFNEYIKNFGFRSRDLEAQARETGNWTKFLARSSENKRSLQHAK